MKHIQKGIWIVQMALCMGLAVFFAGCGRESISLEEALQAAGSEVDVLDGIATDDISSETSGAKTLIYVYICGAVKEPGVYALADGSRIVDAAEAAGGFLESAAPEAVNLAALLSDGMQIIVPDRAQAEAEQAQEEHRRKGQVNLNQADLEELCSLPGIGEAKAEAILAYREELGCFQSIEQIKNVSGIGEKLFEQIKDSIYIE